VSEEEREYLNETIRNLNNQLVDALRERDEARRIVCGLIYDQATSPDTTKQSIAEAEGWDCFKKENT
jgi:hypothetical protein